jgi:hypothetical protein
MHMPRYHLRTLLIAVAVAALGMGTIAGLVRRRESHLRRAAHHRKLSNDASFSAWLIDHRYRWGPSEPERAEMADYERRDHYHAALQANYECAARYPWLPVEPDPPEPT